MNSRVDLISQSAYARRRGVAKSAVAKAVSEGRISLIDGKIDPAVADIQWAQNTRARADSGRTAATGGAGEGVGPSSAPDAPGGAADAPAAEQDEYRSLRTRRERSEVERSERDNLKEAKLLVERHSVERGTYDVVHATRDALMSVGPRAAPKCIGIADARDIERVITEEVRRALEGFESRLLAILPAKEPI